jgi:hypothetical protein
VAENPPDIPVKKEEIINMSVTSDSNGSSPNGSNGSSPNGSNGSSPNGSNGSSPNGSNGSSPNDSISVAIKNRLIQEIERIDKWASVGADNGLFLFGKNNEIYDKIINGLKECRLSLGKNDIPESQRQLSIVIQNYSEAVHAAPRKWRFINLNGGYVFIYLLAILITISSFYAFLGISNFEQIKEMAKPPFSGAGETAIHAVTWGMIGGTLRGMWFLKDKVGDRKFRNSWNLYFVSVPFIGGIFGALIYLIIIAGLLAFDVNSSSNTTPVSPALNNSVTNLADRVKTLDPETLTKNPNPQDSPSPMNSAITDPQPEIQSAAFIQIQNSGTTTSASPTSGEPSPTDKKIELENSTTTNTQSNANETEQANKINATIQDIKKDVVAIQKEIEKMQASQIVGQPLTIIPFAALAGFNWEWLLMTFKRVGNKQSPGENNEITNMLNDDISKLDR